MRTIYELSPGTPYYTEGLRAGLDEYERDGYEVVMLSTLQTAAEWSASQGLSGQCEEIIQEVYKGEYPILGPASGRRPDTLGRVATSHLFGLKDRADQSIVATASLVERPDRFGANIRYAELCKAAKRPNSTVSAAAFGRARVPWTIANLPIDFLYGAARIGEAHDGIPSGQGAQSMWWGGQAELPAITTCSNWQYMMGKGIEPIDGFVIPANRRHWMGEAVRPHRNIFVPCEADRLQLQTVLDEAMAGKLNDVVQVADTVPEVSPDVMAFGVILPGSDLFGGKYVMTRRTHELAVATKDEVDWGFESTFSQRITIETDIARTSLGAGIMRRLCEVEGFSLAGMEPSYLDYGALCPVLARVNPASVNQLIAPVHNPQYFDAQGLAGTRQVLEATYAEMRAKAA